MKFKVLLIILIFSIISIPVFSQETAVTDTAAAGLEESIEGTVPAEDAEPVDPYDESQYVFDDSDAETGETDGAETDGASNPSSVGGIVRAVGVFLLILLVIYLIYYFMKKMGGKRFQNSKLINVISSQGLTNNKTLHLVEIGKEIFLVGAADNSINLISKIEDKESKDMLHLDVSAENPMEKPTFKSIISNIFNKNRVEEKQVQSSDDFIKQQSDRLKNL